MRKTNLIWLAMLPAVSLAGADRPGQLMSAYGEIGRDIVVRLTCVAQPPMERGWALPGGISVPGDRVQRYLRDGATNEYFGYDLFVDPGTAPNRHVVRIEPLSLGTARRRLPKYPPPQIVEDGDVIALDLAISPNGKQKIVDYIEVERKVEPPAKDTAEPRDFTLDDGPLSFNFRSPTKLLLNGQDYPGMLGMTGKPGGTLWFAISGRGRYILSLAPHEGFVKAGAIRDNVIAFQDGGERYELRTSGPIIGSGGVWNLYLLRDPLFPASRGVQYGTDRLANLLPKQ